MNIAPSLPRNTDIAMLEESLERYLRESYSFDQRRAWLKSPSGFDRTHWNFLAESGFLGLPFSEHDGGFGGSLVDVMSVMRHLGRALVLEPYLACIIVAGRLLAHSQSNAQKKRWLAALIAGENLVALAHLERGDRGRGASPGTVVTSESGRLRLNGAKVLVPVAQSLDAMLVTARDPHGKLCVLLVPASAPGVSIRPYRGTDGHVVGDVRFDGVELDQDAQLEFADLEAVLDEVLTYADAAICAEGVGCMQSLLEMTAEYLRTRKQFGQPIGTFQVLKHRLVDCYASVEQAFCVLERAAVTTSPHWKANVAGARAFIGEQALRRHEGSDARRHGAHRRTGGQPLTSELWLQD
jgi:alkylation response protein AidB-like acyl-CoA dehydrogenase